LATGTKPTSLESRLAPASLLIILSFLLPSLHNLFAVFHLYIHLPLSEWHASKAHAISVNHSILGVPAEATLARPTNTDTLQYENNKQLIKFRATFVAQLAESVREWNIVIDGVARAGDSLHKAHHKGFKQSSSFRTSQKIFIRY
jgi:hypothetical protein